MPTPVHAAARRLRGHLVATPVIGDLRLPGFVVPVDVRVKVECLQVAGCLVFRGYLHHLLASLGRHKGLVLHGPPRWILAQAIAAALHRLPIVAVVAERLPPTIAFMAGNCDCEVIEAEPAELDSRVVAVAVTRGFRVAPGLDDDAVADGVATVGLELAEELPEDVSRVLISPQTLAAPLGRGLAAAGRTCQVVGVDDPVPDAVRIAVADGLRVVSDPRGLAALQPVLGQAACEPTCVVLSE